MKPPSANPTAAARASKAASTPRSPANARQPLSGGEGGDTNYEVHHVGKKKAGRELDGELHDGYPA